jgi:CheY-like chemotaxis protein
LQFKTLGVAVDVASDGEEALQALALRSYALVFMDCQMPRLDGLEATRRIRLREKETGRRIPIVALTAHALAAERRRCEEAGMDGVLTKPVRREELETCLLRFSAGKATPALATKALPAIVSELLEIGGTALVEDMLNQWHEQESVRVERLNMLVLSRDSSEALRIAHALKGVAATTGLENLRSTLCQVEEYIQGARWRDAERALEQVHGTYVTDIAAIRLALGRTGTLQDEGLR